MKQTLKQRFDEFIVKLKKRLGLEREMTSQNIINTDIYRYKRNKLAANLALLGLFINCLYFMLFYGINFDSYATMLIGGSVLVNLIVLLVTFLASEGVKVYNKNYSYVLLVLAVVQIVRIFIYPLDIASGGSVLNIATSFSSMRIRYFGITYTGNTGGVSAILIVYLVLSAACLLASAVIGYIRAVQLEKFNKDLAQGVYTVENALADLDAQDEAAASAAEDEAAAEEV